MSEKPRSLLTSHLHQVIASAIGLTIGTFLIIVCIRDFLLYLDSYDLTMVGTTGSLNQIFVVAIFGWSLVLAALVVPLSITLSAGNT